MEQTLDDVKSNHLNRNAEQNPLKSVKVPEGYHSVLSSEDIIMLMRLTPKTNTELLEKLATMLIYSLVTENTGSMTSQQWQQVLIESYKKAMTYERTVSAKS